MAYKYLKLDQLQTQRVNNNVPPRNRTKRQELIDALDATDEEATLRVNANGGQIAYENLTVRLLKALILNRGEQLPDTKDKAGYINQLRAFDAAAVPGPGPAAANDGNEEEDEEIADEPENPDANDVNAVAPVDDEDDDSREKAHDQTEDIVPFLRLVRKAIAASGLSADDVETLNTVLRTEYDPDSANIEALVNDCIVAVEERESKAEARKAEVDHLEKFYIRLPEYKCVQNDDKAAWARLRDHPTYFDYVECHIDFVTALGKLSRATKRLEDAFGGIELDTTDAQEAIEVVKEYVRGLRAIAERQTAAAEKENDCLRDRGTQDNYRKAIREEIKKRLDPTVRAELDSTWTGGWQTGQGGFGGVSVWMKQGSDGRIADRLAVKNSYSPPDAGLVAAWDDDDLWSPQPSNPSKRIPNEVLAMYMLRGKEGSDTVVRIRNWRISYKDRYLRLFMEWCPFSDLGKLANQHIEDGIPIPEAFLWHVFESLAIAGLLMQYGELEHNPVTAWAPIVPRDYKSNNVFLGDYSSSRFRSYPLPKLGDFGFAFFSRPSDDRDPSKIMDWGTPNFMAPEQAHHIIEDGEKVRPLSEKTNVWCVGHVLWTLVMFQGRIEVDFSSPRYREPQFYPDRRHLKTWAGWYTGDLIELIEDCARYSPDDRPSFRQVLDRAREAMHQHGFAALDSLSKPSRQDDGTEIIGLVPGGVPGTEIEDPRLASTADTPDFSRSDEAATNHESQTSQAAAGALQAQGGRKRKPTSVEGHSQRKR